MLRARHLVLPALLSALAPGIARAQDNAGQPYPWVAYAGLGVGLGGATGLASSYLLERRGHGLDDHPLWYGMGVGALSGLALGLGLGLVDRAVDTDLGFGLVAGGAVLVACGALIGGVENVSYDFFSKLPLGGGDFEPLDHAAFPVGAAWGALAGVAGALLLTLFELGTREDAGRRPFLVLTVGAEPAGRGRTLWMPALAGRY
jgi:hypothetical protein